MRLDWLIKLVKLIGLGSIVKRSFHMSSTFSYFSSLKQMSSTNV